MKIRMILLISLFSVSCYAQTAGGTFQGEIEGVSPFIIHLNSQNGLVEGFYKHTTDSVVVLLKGSLDNAGNLLLTGKNDPYPTFTGVLSGKVVEGNVVLAGRAESHPFYAVDFRGEYRNHSNLDYFSLFLSDKGYVLKCLSHRDDQTLISTCRDENGKIRLLADSLNTRIYLNRDTLIVDPAKGKPAFMLPLENYANPDFSFTQTKECWGGSMFFEFPEQDGDFKPEGSVLVLNDSTSIKLTRIPQSEYIRSKWVAPRSRPYNVITEFAEARNILNKKMRPLQKQDAESGEWFPAGVEFTYNDGTKKVQEELPDLASYPDIFYAYYPELDVLVLENEAGGDEIIDFNISAYREIGNPAQTATSPDGKWRVTGYYPGGAADTDEWWLEVWNPTVGKYEIYLELRNDYSQKEPPTFVMPGYIDGWFWTNDRTVLFKSQLEDKSCYKLEIIVSSCTACS